ncbi:hypothetical protein [Rhizobium sp. BT-226]|uniref:hypothetical protein n=1 Tax=Rhizobium sp. BT-226 TaxID=2986922 RepID=UPI0021F6B6F4|nr:hypothetical protein [Rhizobium sp. BT-226]MCW0021431.1 hypothetical protein [Rhizobium sp. BT-226]
MQVQKAVLADRPKSHLALEGPFNVHDAAFGNKDMFDPGERKGTVSDSNFPPVEVRMRWRAVTEVELNLVEKKWENILLALANRHSETENVQLSSCVVFLVKRRYC